VSTDYEGKNGHRRFGIIERGVALRVFFHNSSICKTWLISGILETPKPVWHPWEKKDEKEKNIQEVGASKTPLFRPNPGQRKKKKKKSATGNEEGEQVSETIHQVLCCAKNKLTWKKGKGKENAMETTPRIRLKISPMCCVAPSA
jgi:hypothetical protein